MKSPGYCFCLFVLTAGLAACSKKDDGAANVTPASEAAPPSSHTPNASPVPQANASVNVGQMENNVKAALQRQDYDAAVNALATVTSAQATMNDAQRLQYAQQMQRTMEALRAAQDTNPQAKAAYERLGRVATGR